MNSVVKHEVNKILFKEESYAIQGAIFEVYKEVGSGFLESIYQECLGRELEMRLIPFIAQPELQVAYKGIPLNQSIKPDFICFSSIILELIATRTLIDEHRAQLFNYLKNFKTALGFIDQFWSHSPS